MPCNGYNKTFLTTISSKFIIKTDELWNVVWVFLCSFFYIGYTSTYSDTELTIEG